MRVLLDECVSERLRNYLAGHECQSARYAGFRGLENGDLLTAAEAAKFDVLLTVDRGFEYEQNLGGRQIAVLILSSKSIQPGRLAAAEKACRRRLMTIRCPSKMHRLPRWVLVRRKAVIRSLACILYIVRI